MAPNSKPISTVIDTLEQRQLVVITSIYLNQTASDLRNLNGAAKVEALARTTLNYVGLAGLIA